MQDKYYCSDFPIHQSWFDYCGAMLKNVSSMQFVYLRQKSSKKGLAGRFSGCAGVEYRERNSQTSVYVTLLGLALFRLLAETNLALHVDSYHSWIHCTSLRETTTTHSRFLKMVNNVIRALSKTLSFSDKEVASVFSEVSPETASELIQTFEEDPKRYHLVSAHRKR